MARNPNLGPCIFSRMVKGIAIENMFFIWFGQYSTRAHFISEKNVVIFLNQFFSNLLNLYIARSVFNSNFRLVTFRDLKYRILGPLKQKWFIISCYVKNLEKLLAMSRVLKKSHRAFC
ncbi:hypothetical protein BpHYR1_024798 [Brachionus plicatilis]|uniref:Uncharacterized protein n=1 Tax=Brachionus plicatilis TaxID=10195 RepID=A0A3M7P2V2_BRAPC|nr:hypothetical protein BpHYR1_024798 [Brachionus plicatilis]